MKLLPFVAVMALVLPVAAAATVAMEAQQVSRSEEVVPSPSAAAKAHRPLFIVKYVLRRTPSEMPPIVMEDASPQIVPPGKGFPATTLGAAQSDPNVLVCYGWGCQLKP